MVSNLRDSPASVASAASPRTALIPWQISGGTPPAERLSALQAELGTTSAKPRQAILRYEIGNILEWDLRDEEAAAKEYLASYNLNPTFVPPLFSLVRIFERRRSWQNLTRLYEAEARSLTQDADRVSSLLDCAALHEDWLRQPEEARRFYESALTLDPSSAVAGLMFFYHAIRTDDLEATQRLLEVRADYCPDGVEKGLLHLQLAAAREVAGDLDGALLSLQEASQQPDERERFLHHLERFCRRHGRVAPLMETLRQQAELAEAWTRKDVALPAFGLWWAGRQATPASFGAMAWWELATLQRYCSKDLLASRSALRQALQLTPDDLLLQYEHLLISEQIGDRADIDRVLSHLLQHDKAPNHQTALLFLAGSQALQRSDSDTAKSLWAQALEHDFQSALSRAALDNLLTVRGEHHERVQLYKNLSKRAAPPARVGLLMRAADIAEHDLRDGEEARRLLESALALTESRWPILREIYAGCLRRGDLNGCRSVFEAHGVPASEDDANLWLYDLFSAFNARAGFEDVATSILDQALKLPAAIDWAAPLAVSNATQRRDFPRLHAAHLVSAMQASDPQQAAAHYSAAARALLRGGDRSAAQRLLKQARSKHPQHLYLNALLSEELLAAGEADAAIELWSPRLPDPSALPIAAGDLQQALLSIGAAAEHGGNLNAAARAYTESAQKSAPLTPTTEAAAPSVEGSYWWTVKRLAERTGQHELLLQSEAELSKLETAAGRPSVATYDLGVHLDLLGNRMDRAEMPLAEVLAHADYGLAAAASLLALPDRAAANPAIRIDAAKKLVAAASEADRSTAWRELGGIALFHPEHHGLAIRAVHEVSSQRPNDRWALYARLRLAGTGALTETERAQAWTALGQHTVDTNAGAELMLHGLRARRLLGDDESNEDRFILAQDIVQRYPESPAAAVALEEAVEFGDDAQTRLPAVEARLHHLKMSDASKAERASAESSYGRTLAMCGRFEPAVNSLKQAVEADPQDLAAWDALRAAAREASDWTSVVNACDVLAAASQGEWRAQLLEEAAIVLIDQLKLDGEAERRLRDAVELDVLRPIASGRLHDLLAARHDVRGLLDLTTMRIQGILSTPGADTSALIGLYYDQARLLRSEVELDAALVVLGRLLSLESTHVAALALVAEIHIALEHWNEAVHALQTLAASDIPETQKRQARLGASTFLLDKLDDPRAALVELKHVESFGRVDSDFYVHLAAVAEKALAFDEAVDALAKAAEFDSGDNYIVYARRLGQILLQRLQNPAAALVWFREVLRRQPSDGEAVEAVLAVIPPGDERRQAIDSFEQGVHRDLLESPADPQALRKLLQIGLWRGDKRFQWRILDVLVALGEATADEHQTHQTAAPELNFHRWRPLSAHGWQTLRGDSGSDTLDALARQGFLALAQTDGLILESYDVGKKDLVRDQDGNEATQQIEAISTVFGLVEASMYRGGADDAKHVNLVIGKRQRCCWVISPHLVGALNADQRFRVGTLATSFCLQTAPWVLLPDNEALPRLVALILSLQGQVADRGEDRRYDNWVRSLQKNLARAERRQGEELVRGRTWSAERLTEWLQMSRSVAYRGGLICAGSIAMPLKTILGGPVSVASIRACKEARDLVDFWISQTPLQLDEEVGRAA